MIVLLAGASHTGKTAAAQRLLEQYHYPYLSIDHLKMGLIRSGQTTLTPEDDGPLEAYLWPIVREIIRTALENGQNLIVEGAYLPFDWEKDFSESERRQIRYFCLIMSERYIRQHFADIRRYADCVEHRLDDAGFTAELALRDNAANLAMCRQYGCRYIWIDEEYCVDIRL